MNFTPEFWLLVVVNLGGVFMSSSNLRVKIETRLVQLETTMSIVKRKCLGENCEQRASDV